MRRLTISQALTEGGSRVPIEIERYAALPAASFHVVPVHQIGFPRVVS